MPQVWKLVLLTLGFLTLLELIYLVWKKHDLKPNCSPVVSKSKKATITEKLVNCNCCSFRNKWKFFIFQKNRCFALREYILFPHKKNNCTVVTCISYSSRSFCLWVGRFFLPVGITQGLIQFNNSFWEEKEGIKTKTRLSVLVRPIKTSGLCRFTRVGVQFLRYIFCMTIFSSRFSISPPRHLLATSTKCSSSVRHQQVWWSVQYVMIV